MTMPTLNRRTFVRGLGTSLAAVPLAPLFLPSRARGANDRIRLGFIGVGKMGMGHLNAFVKMSDVEIRAVSDLEQSRREQGAAIVDKQNAADKRPAGQVAMFSDYREMLAKSDLDAVLIATPDHWHTTALIHCAQAKKDIYCEKPLTLTLEESELVIKAVRKNRVIMQTGSQQRSENEGRFRVAAAYVLAHRIGAVTAISGHFGATSKACDLPGETMAPGLDWDRWLGQAPARPYHHLLCQRGDPEKYPFTPGWRDYSEYSGGQVTDWGCHHLDIVQWALGMDGSGPSQILPPRGENSRGGGMLIYKKTPVGDDIVVTHRTYGNGIRFFGTTGEIWVNRNELVATPPNLWKEKLSDAELNFDGNLGGATADWSGSEKNLPPKIATINHRRNWLDCIRSRKDPVCKVEVGAGTAAVCHLLNLAYWNKRAISWNPATWSGVPAAWRARPARKGYELPRV